MIYDVVIIGSGPAGLSAAIYTARAKLKTLVIAKDGGRCAGSHRIENYFGIESVTGDRLLETGKKQAQNFGAEFLHSEIIDLKKEGDFTITTSNKEINAKNVILANGLSSVSSGISNEKQFVGKGVSYCVQCDAFFFRDKKVAVLGNSDFTAHEALLLLPHTKDVTLFTASKDLKISPKMLKKLEKGGVVIRNEKIKEAKGDGMLSSIVLEDGEEKIDGLFIALGASASELALKLGLEMDGDFVKTDINQQTNIQGLYAAGDCTSHALQIAKAVGDGCNAAVSIIKNDS